MQFISMIKLAREINHIPLLNGCLGNYLLISNSISNQE